MRVWELLTTQHSTEQSSFSSSFKVLPVAKDMLIKTGQKTLWHHSVLVSPSCRRTCRCESRCEGL